MDQPPVQGHESSLGGYMGPAPAPAPSQPRPRWNHATIGVAIALAVLIGVIVYLTYRQPATGYEAEYPIDSTTVDFDRLKRLLQTRVQDIRSGSSLLTPYDSAKLDQVSAAVDSATSINQLQTLVELMPNNTLGFYTIESLDKADPTDFLSFQFDQGRIGWIWIYSTWIDPVDSSKDASFMFYLMRHEAVGHKSREKEGLKRGESAFYTVSMGVGRGGQWYYNPYTVCRGHYTAVSGKQFTFEAVDFPGSDRGAFCRCSSSADGRTLDISSRWVDSWHLAPDATVPAQVPETALYGFDVVMTAKRAPDFNSAGGCVPCTGGTGTLYMSYTDLVGTGTLHLDREQWAEADGVGWQDIQWGGSPVSQVSTQALLNVYLMTTNVNLNNLGRYVWLNLNLAGLDLQYMVIAMPAQDVVVEPGAVFSAAYIAYSSGYATPVYLEPVDITVHSTTVVGETVYPTAYTMTLDGRRLLLDSTPFGKTITIDGTNNEHWSGSAELLDADTRAHLGAGFLEANQFDPSDKYYQNIIRTAGLDSNDAATLERFTDFQLSFWQALPSILLLLAPVLLAVGLLILLLRKPASKSAEQLPRAPDPGLTTASPASGHS